MYEDLVKSLRTDHDKYFARDMEAADAIEELCVVVESYRNRMAYVPEQKEET